MASIDLLGMLKASLQIWDNQMDEEAKAEKDAELNQYINSAQVYIKRTGITLDLDDIGDAQLVVFYADWLYTTRRAPAQPTANGKQMGSNYPGQPPRALKRNLNDRLMEEKAKQNAI